MSLKELVIKKNEKVKTYRDIIANLEAENREANTFERGKMNSLISDMDNLTVRSQKLRASKKPEWMNLRDI